MSIVATSDVIAARRLCPIMHYWLPANAGCIALLPLKMTIFDFTSMATSMEMHFQPMKHEVTLLPRRRTAQCDVSISQNLAKISPHFGSEVPWGSKYRYFWRCPIFTARRYASAVLAMTLCPSVCLSQVGVLLKRLNLGSHKQYHTIAQGF